MENIYRTSLKITNDGDEYETWAVACMHIVVCNYVLFCFEFFAAYRVLYMFVLKVAVEMKMRDLTEIDALLDYDKPIPNPRHEKGRPGGANKWLHIPTILLMSHQEECEEG